MVRQIAYTITLAAFAVAAMGQTAPPSGVIQYRTGGAMAIPAPPPPGEMLKFVGAEFRTGGAIVKGAPYSADSVTESVQVLADGTRITRKNTASDYRDGEGRTRHEQTLESVGPWSSDQSHKMIFINDPVASTNYVVDPEQRTISKFALQPIEMDSSGQAKKDVMIGMKNELRIESGVQIAVSADHMEVGSTTAPGRAGVLTAMKTKLMDEANAKTESLGSKTIEGVQAEGTRMTITIPVGRIGNDRALQIVSERWYSPELQTVVMTKRTDPQAGEQTFQLQNIRRSEPSHSLFEPPADYAVQQGPQMIHFETKQDK